MALAPGPQPPQPPGSGGMWPTGVERNHHELVLVAVLMICFLLVLIVKRRASSGRMHTRAYSCYDTELDGAIDMVKTDAKCRELKDMLLKYAEEEVEKNKEELEKQLRKRQPLTLDLLWPGSGYNSVACGGNFAVLGHLEKKGLLTVGRILGSSGGACSSILCLADKDASAQTLLHYYMVYAKWSEHTWDFQVMQETPIWTRIYKRILNFEGAFKRLQDRGWVAVMTGTWCSNTVYHNFKTHEQCMQAYYSSGNFSLKGVLGFSPRIPELPSSHGHACDGGAMTIFPNRESAVLYYNTSYDNSTAMNCTLESIEKLFKEGVNQTILALTSDKLQVEKSADGCGGMRVALPGPSGCVGADEFQGVKKEFGLMCPQTRFYNIRARTEDVQHRF